MVGGGDRSSVGVDPVAGRRVVGKSIRTAARTHPTPHRLPLGLAGHLYPKGG